tara:strand:- start:12246 stop:12602 length:357 start_codon:yes stop_codon:yes gene_type:complete
VVADWLLCPQKNLSLVRDLLIRNQRESPLLHVRNRRPQGCACSFRVLKERRCGVKFHDAFTHDVSADKALAALRAHDYETRIDNMEIQAFVEGVWVTVAEIDEDGLVDPLVVVEFLDY